MEKIEERVLNEAKYLLQNFCTIREVAKKFKVCKSTVHNDLSVRLKTLDYTLYSKIQYIFKYNIYVRHIRGGQSTKLKYEKKKSIN